MRFSIQSAWRWLIVLGVGIAIGAVSTRAFSSKSASPHESTSNANQNVVWTCSMHPQIRMPKPGKCPICGMDLIPLKSSAESGNPRVISLSEAARKLAKIEVAPVVRKYVAHTVHMVGKVAYDETRVKTISARVPGRIDRLFVDYTGIPVKQGDPMVSLYSQELFSVQEELLQAAKTVDNLKDSTSESAKAMAQSTLNATKEKLRLWGFSDDQIQGILRHQKTEDHLTVLAPLSGIVVEKHVNEGMYVETGMPFYTVADLSSLWIKLDAYEMDLAWLRYGQDVELSVEAYPGEVFKGRIAFLDPVLNDATRTVKVRVHVANPNGRLRPEMFVRAMVKSQLASDGKVVNPDFSGKWISSMHPEIVKDKPGTCDVCGMPLVSAESLGYATVSAQAPLVIPASAPLITGKRAVVYVATDATGNNFECRTIGLGPRAEDYYLVQDGLAEGEKIVVNGVFKVDSASQILGKPSMMRPDEDAGSSEPKTAVPREFQEQFSGILAAYFEMQQALSKDALHAAHANVSKLKEAVGKADMSLLSGTSHQDWMADQAAMNDSVAKLSESADLQSMREAFALLSESVIASTRRYSNQQTYVIHCPMAFNNRGADWLQADKAVANPYFGSAMEKCGEVKEILPSNESK